MVGELEKTTNNAADNLTEQSAESVEQTESAPPKASETTDIGALEKRLKDTQAKLTELVEQNKQLSSYVEAVSPYVDFSKTGTQMPMGQLTAEGTALEDTDDPSAQIKALKNEIEQLKAAQVGYQRLVEFRQKHPDMTPYEDLVAGAMASMNPQLPVEQRLEKAVEHVRSILREQREAALKEAQKEAEMKKKEQAQQIGISVPETGKEATKSKDIGDLTEDELLKEIETARLKKRGLA